MNKRVGFYEIIAICVEYLIFVKASCKTVACINPVVSWTKPLKNRNLTLVPKIIC